MGDFGGKRGGRGYIQRPELQTQATERERERERF